MSPCLAVPGSQKKLDTPILDNVADTFLAIKPDLPTPAQITLPLQLKIRSTARAKDLLKILLIFWGLPLGLSRSLHCPVALCTHLLRFRLT